jgi:adhesin transport system outer membrane protein
MSFLLMTPSYALTLDNTIRATIANNPDILTTMKDHDAITEALRQAKAPYYPHVRVNFGYGPDKNVNSNTIGTETPSPTMPKREEGVLLSQMLFDGFATKNDVARNTARVSSAVYKVLASVQDNVQRNIEVYAGVVKEQELVLLAQQNLDFHEKIARMIKLRAERGISRRADQYQAEARLSLARSNLLAELSNLADAKANFYRTIGLAPEGLAPLPQPDLRYVPKTQQEALDIAIKNNPVVRSANADVIAAIEQHQVAKATNFPHFDLQVGLSRDRNVGGVRGPSFDQYAVVHMTYDLYNGGADISKQRETAYQEQQATEIKLHAIRQLIEAVKLTWDLFITARDQLPMLSMHVIASEKTVRAYAEQYQIGQRTLLDLLDSQNELFSAKRSYVNGRFDMYTSRYRLLRDTGIQIVALHLEPDLTDNAYTDAANDVDLHPEANLLDKSHYGLSIEASDGNSAARRYLNAAATKAKMSRIELNTQPLPEDDPRENVPAATKSYDTAPPVPFSTMPEPITPPTAVTPPLHQPSVVIPPAGVAPPVKQPNVTTPVPLVSPQVSQPSTVAPMPPIQQSHQSRPMAPLTRANPKAMPGRVVQSSDAIQHRKHHPQDELLAQMAEINKQSHPARQATAGRSIRVAASHLTRPMARPASVKSAGWFIQVGCFKDKANAGHVVAKLRAARFSVVQKDLRTAKGAMTYIYVGPQTTLPAAKMLAGQLVKRVQLHGFPVQV